MDVSRGDVFDILHPDAVGQSGLVCAEHKGALAARTGCHGRSLLLAVQPGLECLVSLLWGHLPANLTVWMLNRVDVDVVVAIAQVYHVAGEEGERAGDRGVGIEGASAVEEIMDDWSVLARLPLVDVGRRDVFDVLHADPVGQAVFVVAQE